MRGRRFRMRVLMPWLGLALALLGMALLVWYLLGRGRASSLDLVAWDRSGLAGDRVRLEPVPNDPLGAGTPRVPLLLALRNEGPVALRAGRVTLSLPSWLRLERDDGTPIEGEADGGNPLMRYVVSLDPPVRLEPGAYPAVLPESRRLWIRPFTSPWRCTLDDDGLPAFLPAPPLDPTRLASARLFWTVDEARSGRRATGTLELSLDPGLFAAGTVTRPPVYPARPLPADSPRPDLGTLVVQGTRTAACGGMIEPLTLHSTEYRTEGGGRILAVAVDDAPARLLFDLDGNDTIEAEAWSAAGSGPLDRVRRARYPIPDFLLPLPPPPDPAAAAADSLAVDSLGTGIDSLRADTGAVTDTTRAAPVPADTTAAVAR